MKQYIYIYQLSLFSEKLLTWPIVKLLFVERTILIKLSITSIQYIHKVTNLNKSGPSFAELCYIKVIIYELLSILIFD